MYLTKKYKMYQFRLNLLKRTMIFNGNNVGMRNIIVHGCGTINLNTIWETSMTDILVLLDFCKRKLK